MPAAERYLPPPPLLFLPSLLLISCLDGAVRAAEGGGLPSSPGDNGVIAAVGDPSPTYPTDPGRFLSPSALIAESQFALKVLVRDVVTRQPLSGASVDVYVNHTLRSSDRTGARGEVLLWVAYSPGLRLTLLGNMEGYVPRPLPWSTSKRPIFSAVTLPLLPHSQGNVWLFEDSVLITRKLPDSSSQPKVKFPKNLLTISDKSNVSSVTAYLTVPQHHLAKDCANCTPGIISNKSVFRSIELRPAAAVSVLLYSGDEELRVRGPIQISLPLGHNTFLRASDTVPAWAFNLKTGAWENQGLGIVKTVGNELVWTYTASHLGYWIAAVLPSSNDYLGHGSTMDFISYHTYLLIGILGGTLAIVIGLLSLLLCHCGGSHREPRRRRRRARFSKLAVLKKDQTTSTHTEEGLLFRSGDNSLASCSVQCEPSSTPRHKANYNIYVEDPGCRPAAPLYKNIASDRIKGPQQPPHYINSEDVARLREKSEQNRANMNDNFFQDKLVHIYNRPVAIIQAPELFGAQEQQLSGCKAATFPRNGVEYDAHSEPASKDGYTRTLPKVPHHHSQGGSSTQQSSQDEPQPLETQGQGPNTSVWGRYSNLLESSVSVPGTLNEAAGMEAFSSGHGVPGELQGISERTLLELTRGKSSSSHPRAWFVSLDGKPAAQVRHSIIELQSRRRPPSSNDTSLDSGVDMNEPQQNIRETERDGPSIRASSLPHRSRGGRCGEEQDLSSSESGNTATCTPEDPSLRNILDGSSGAIPDIPEERDGMDTSSAQEDSESRGTPPPRRLRKVREKGKTEKRSAKHVREGRPLTKRS
ncbi:protein FAM171B-like [Seriola lalandi dorsalis]|uniref:Family with sequence similarity 171 member B n=1 Tax=Seriola lalandi dorsalis TaxID=1841481 RepID=A0A3B4Z4C3_SERLL|nr:protein FAM171B-like [Seriola lalandi dorsalis]